MTGWTAEETPAGDYAETVPSLRERCVAAVQDALVESGKTEYDMDGLLAVVLDTVEPMIRGDAERSGLEAAVKAAGLLVDAVRRADAARRTATELASGLMALRGEIGKLREKPCPMHGPDEPCTWGEVRIEALDDVLALLDEIDRRAIETPDPGEAPAAVPEDPRGTTTESAGRGEAPDETAVAGSEGTAAGTAGPRAPWNPAPTDLENPK